MLLCMLLKNTNYLVLFYCYSCVQAYHHFEDPIHVTRALAQRLKPKRRLIIIDFIEDGQIDQVFAYGREDKSGHTVPHKHG